MLTEDELRRMMADLESDRVERTTSTNKTDKHCRAICAFAIASEQEERILVERRASRFKSFDLRPCRGATKGDLVMDLFFQYRSHSVAPDVVEENHRPTKAYGRWMRQIPEVYRRSVLDRGDPAPLSVEDDPECLGVLKHYRSLMPMAQDARKPIFRLKPADGAMGSHATAVRDAYRDFETLAWAIARRSELAQ
jgi:hypothetical protein